jgi:hypothetical protein
MIKIRSVLLSPIRQNLNDAKFYVYHERLVFTLCGDKENIWFDDEVVPWVSPKPKRGI